MRPGKVFPFSQLLTEQSCELSRSWASLGIVQLWPSICFPSGSFTETWQCLLVFQFALSIQTLKSPLSHGECIFHPASTHRVMCHVPKEQPLKAHAKASSPLYKPSRVLPKHLHSILNNINRYCHHGSNQLIITFKPQLVCV